MMFDSSGNEYEPDDLYDYCDSDIDRSYMDSSTYQSDPDIEVTGSLLEKKPEVHVTISRNKDVVSSLSQQAANVIGARLPFEAVEQCARRLGKKLADEVQLAVMKASFPVDKGLIRRYAYLSRKSGDDRFSNMVISQPKLRRHRKKFAVENAMQIGER